MIRQFTLSAERGGASLHVPAARVDICGIRAESGDIAITGFSAGAGTLSSNNNGVAVPIDFTSLTWKPGMWVHVGGVANGALRLKTGASVFIAGYVRLLTVAANSCTFDKATGTLANADGTTDNSGGANIVVDLLFGSHVRNVEVDQNVDDSRYLERAQLVMREGGSPSGERVRRAHALRRDGP